METRARGHSQSRRPFHQLLRPARCGCFGCWYARGQADDLRFLRGQRQRAAPAAAEHERRVRSLVRLWPPVHLRDLVIAPLEAERTIAKQALEDLHRLAHALRTAPHDGRRNPAPLLSSAFQPAPRPTSSRPSLSTSSIAPSWASPAGCRRSLFSTKVPSRNRVVAIATAVSAGTEPTDPAGGRR